MLSSSLFGTLRCATLLATSAALAMSCVSANGVADPPPASPSTRAIGGVVVVDGVGTPVAGAHVYWAAPGYPTFACDPSAHPLPGGYVWSGEATTDEHGHAQWAWPPQASESDSFDRPLSLQVVGPSGRRALSSITSGAPSKTIVLSDNVDLDLGFRCGGGQCDGLSGQLTITRDQGRCVIRPLKLADGRLRMNDVPQGTLSVVIHAAQQTSHEATATKTITLTSDLHATIDLRVVGGPHTVDGTVRLLDGTPPKGDGYWTSIEAHCATELKRSTDADSTGHFELTHLPPGDCSLTATRHGYQQQAWAPTTKSVDPSTAHGVELVVSPKD